MRFRTGDGLPDMNQQKEKSDQPIFEPPRSVRYTFLETPRSDCERFTYFVQRQLALSEIVAESARMLNQSPEVAAKKSFRLGIFRVKNIFDVLPLLRIHPTKRLLQLTLQAQAELQDILQTNDLEEIDKKKSLDVLKTIQTLIEMSFVQYPGQLDSPLIQEAFREADTVREDVFLSDASFHFSGKFIDVEKVTA